MAFIESIAQLKPHIEWAKKAVIESASIVTAMPKKMNVIDIVAADVSHLIKSMAERSRLETKP
ncbi:MAG: hypothetical protein R2877_05320 [Bdellovibrionota bacterium]